MKRLGPVSYLMNEGVRKRTVHINHLLLSHGELGIATTHVMTPNLDSKQPISIQEAEGRISAPVLSNTVGDYFRETSTASGCVPPERLNL